MRLVVDSHDFSIGAKGFMIDFLSAKGANHLQAWYEAKLVKENTIFTMNLPHPAIFLFFNFLVIRHVGGSSV